MRILNRRVKLPEIVFNEIKLSVLDYEDHLIPFMNPKKGSMFIDVGANRGQWSKYLFEKGFNVVAFEPNPLDARFIKSGITVFTVALGDKTGNFPLYLGKLSGHDSLNPKDSEYSGKAIIVKVRTLDSYDFKNVGLIKIDTEGYEIPILKGAKQTIEKCKPQLILEVHRPFKQQKKGILRILKRLGYKWIIRHKKGKSKQPHIIAEPK